MSNRLQPYLGALALLSAVVGCQSRHSASGSAQSTVARSDSSTRMANMPGMPGGTMRMMMDSATDTMMDSMRAEMARMRAMTPEQMKAMMVSHRQTAGNVLAQMNSDMRSMSMISGPAWTALVDSVRQDLIRMPDASGQPLETLMAAHQARMERLMVMYRNMMRKMSGAK